MALGMPRGEMLMRMSSEEISEWMAFFQVEPFGVDVEMYGPAIVAATIANVNRSKNQKAYSPEDFMPKWQRLGDQGVNHQIQIAEMFTAALGGADLRDE